MGQTGDSTRSSWTALTCPTSTCRQRWGFNFWSDSSWRRWSCVLLTDVNNNNNINNNNNNNNDSNNNYSSNNNSNDCKAWCAHRYINEVLLLLQLVLYLGRFFVVLVRKFIQTRCMSRPPSSLLSDSSLLVIDMNDISIITFNKMFQWMH